MTNENEKRGATSGEEDKGIAQVVGLDSLLDCVQKASMVNAQAFENVARVVDE